MASLTVRNLDDAVKAQLRVRAAANGRSVEEELRVILREAALGPAASVRVETGSPPVGTMREPGHEGPRTASPLANEETETAAPRHTHRVTLIIGGGIAAYKSLDLIRRLKERDAHVRVVLTRAAQAFVTPLSASALARGGGR